MFLPRLFSCVPRLCASVALVPLLAVCADLTWVGSDGGEWTDPANWSSGALPTKEDTVTFDPGDVESYTVNVSANGNCGGLNFVSGGDFLLKIGSNCRIYLKTGTADLFVSDGVSLTISNALVAASARATTLRKTGPGKVRFTATNGDGLTGVYWGWFKAWDFAGGVAEFDPPTTCPIRSPVTIRSGATLKCAQNYLFSSDVAVHLEEGSILDLKGATNTYLDGFSGSGVITNVWELFSVALTNGPYLFSGRLYPDLDRLDDKGKPLRDFVIVKFDKQNARNPNIVTPIEKYRFILGSSNAFENVIVEYPASERSPLAFAEGIGEFHVFRMNPSGLAPILLEDVSGKPISLYTDCGNLASLWTSGCGTFCFDRGYGRMMTAQQMPKFTGFTGSFGTRKDRLTFGNGTAEGWVAALPPEITLFATYPGNGDTWCGLEFNAPADSTVEMANPIVGNGAYTFYGNVKTTGFDVQGGVFHNKGDTTLSGANAHLSRYHTYFYNDTVLTVRDGAYYGGADRSVNEHYGRPLRHAETIFYNRDSHTNRTVKVCDGGTVCWGQTVPDFTVVSKGGTFETYCGMNADRDKSITWDGGTLRLLDYVSFYNMNADAGNGTLSHFVGANGMTIEILARHYPYNGGFHKIYFRNPVRPAAGVSSDGGVRRIGPGYLLFMAPLETRGLFDNADGTLLIRNYEAMVNASGPLFGLGDFRLGNARVEVADSGEAENGVTSPITARIGTGGNFVYGGAGLVSVRIKASDDVVHSFALGNAVRDDRGTLFIHDAAATLGGDVTFTSAPAMDSAGRIIAPIFTVAADVVDFASYASGKVTQFGGYVPLANGGASSVAIANAAMTVASSTSVAALKVKGNGSLNTSSASGNSIVTISAGATLSVGDGVNPAPVILQSAGGSSVASIDGAGTLDFGTSEGVIIGCWLANGAYPVRVRAKIAGQNGLTLAAPPTFNGSGMVVELYGENTYSGDTVINGVQAIPKSDTAFSSGKVRIGDGALAGGCVRFETPGIRLENDFCAAGSGSRFRELGGAASQHCFGAFLFTADGEVAGNVEVYAPMRMTAYGEGVTGTFSGTISGGSIEIGSCKAGLAYENGRIVFTGSNTYTGGTELVSSTLVLKDGGTAGTGVVMLNEGTLEIDNSAETTVANRITGCGRIRLVGAAQVNLPNLAPDFPDEKFTLALTRRVGFISTLNGIGAIETSRSGTTRLVVADGSHETYSGSLPANVTLLSPEEYSEKGFMVIVR